MDEKREAFEKWLADVHMLTAEWQPERNCYKQFAAHLAWRAWLAASPPNVGNKA